MTNDDDEESIDKMDVDVDDTCTNAAQRAKAAMQRLSNTMYLIDFYVNGSLIRLQIIAIFPFESPNSYRKFNANKTSPFLHPVIIGNICCRDRRREFGSFKNHVQTRQVFLT